MASWRKIPLTALEPSNVSRRDFPLTVGLPMAPGQLGADEPVALVDAAGRLVPVQGKVIEKHGDGSVRWLLLDYQADFEPLQRSTYTLEFGRQGAVVPEGRRVRLSERGDVLVIENGPLRIEAHQTRCQPMAKVWRDGELVSEGGLSCWVTDAGGNGGNQFFAERDGEVRFSIEQQGPMRVRLRWEGTHQDAEGRRHFDFVIRLSVFAGLPYVRVDHVFINRLDEAQTPVNQIAVSLPMRMSGPCNYTLGGASAGHFSRGTPYQAVASDEPARLDMTRFDRYDVTTLSGGKELAKGRKSMGWVSAASAKRSVMLAGKCFWQNFPKALQVRQDELLCELVPKMDQPFVVPRGMAKTHTFFLSFDLGKTDDCPPDVRAAQIQRWPMPTAPTEYYRDSGEFWDYFPSYPQDYPQLDAALRKFFQPDSIWSLIYPPVERAYGLKHYGDFVHPANSGTTGKVRGGLGPDPDAPDTYYMNNEYDAPHVMAILFLRMGEIALFWGVEAHALHMIDLDTCHHAVPAPPNEMLHDWRCLVNCQYRHCFQHVGGIQKPDETRHVPAEGSHTFAEGLLDMYHITGDRRFFEVTRNYALHLSYMVNERGYRWNLERGSGWAMTLLSGVYKIEPDPAIYRAAQIMIESAIKDVRLASSHGVGTSLRGFMRWHQITGDERVGRLILGAADRFLSEACAADGMVKGSQWPEDFPTAPIISSAGVLEPLAYCYDLTGDRKYIDGGVPLLHGLVQWLHHPSGEKGRALWERILRGPFRFMSIAHELGILHRIPGAGPWAGAAADAVG